MENGEACEDKARCVKKSLSAENVNGRQLVQLFFIHKTQLSNETVMSHFTLATVDQKSVCPVEVFHKGTVVFEVVVVYFGWRWWISFFQATELTGEC